MNFTWSEDDVICTDKFLAAFPDNYVKTDVFYAYPVYWRGNFVGIPPTTQTTFVCGHSDYPVTEPIVQYYPPAVWFAVNSQSPNVIGLPLGITNNTDESPLHKVFGNVDVMLAVVQQPRVNKNLAYLNISVETYPKERGLVKTMFKDMKWVTQGAPVNTLDGRKKFLEEVRNHSFVFCPRGNGVDTHRLWETLYMGSIPIVKRDIAHAGWTDLPILFIDDWSEITEEKLLAEKRRIETSKWNLDKLRVRYWIDRIKNGK
jgi:hypothetical protein